MSAERNEKRGELTRAQLPKDALIFLLTVKCFKIFYIPTRPYLMECLVALSKVPFHIIYLENKYHQHLYTYVRFMAPTS